MSEEQGVEAYYRSRRVHEDEVLPPGMVFRLVQRLLASNGRPLARPRVALILLSRDTARTPD